MPKPKEHEHKKPPKHHLPPHIEHEIKKLIEKVARLEGKVDVILKVMGESKKR